MDFSEPLLSKTKLSVLMKHTTDRIATLMAGFLVTFLLTGTAMAQNDYAHYRQLTDQLQNLSSEYSSLASLQSLATTEGGREVWLLTIGSGDLANHAGIAVIGGANGAHILGSELSVRFAESLLQRAASDSIRAILDNTTFYIVPRLNPDATEQYFSDLIYERKLNGTATDGDRDGSVDEDPYEDLNGDGLITMMRVKDPTGNWMTYGEDARVMVKADPGEGEQGTFRLLTEGRDNDSDGAFNEDPEGGVNLNRNFTFNYPSFTPGAGEHMLSENENRGLLDFLFEKAWNTFAVVSFGPENNLSNPVSFNRGGINKRVISSWYREDVDVNKLVSDLYNRTTGLDGAPNGDPRPGDLLHWAYFHYGRFSFSTPGWWPAKLKDRPKNDDAAYLAWADSNGVDAFVEWQEINHPDFPDKQVEVGGLKPFHTFTPPYTAVDSLAEKHTRFLLELARYRPDLQVLETKTERVSSELTRVTMTLHNRGKLPTASRLGERTRWVRDVKVELQTSEGNSIVSGKPVTYYDAIGADESREISWLIRGDGDLTIHVGAPQTGFSTNTISIASI